MFVVLLAALLVVGPAAEERIALVVGKSNYQHFAPLATPRSAGSCYTGPCGLVG
jgi:hypothetical protein